LLDSVEASHEEYWSVGAECLKLNASNELSPFWERTFEILSQSVRDLDQIRAAARKLDREHQTADIGKRLTRLDQQSEELLRDLANALEKMPSVIAAMKKIAENRASSRPPASLPRRSRSRTRSPSPSPSPWRSPSRGSDSSERTQQRICCRQPNRCRHRRHRDDGVPTGAAALDLLFRDWKLPDQHIAALFSSRKHVGQHTALVPFVEWVIKHMAVSGERKLATGRCARGTSHCGGYKQQELIAEYLKQHPASSVTRSVFANTAAPSLTVMWKFAVALKKKQQQRSIECDVCSAVDCSAPAAAPPRNSAAAAGCAGDASLDSDVRPPSPPPPAAAASADGGGGEGGGDGSAPQWPPPPSPAAAAADPAPPHLPSSTSAAGGEGGAARNSAAAAGCAGDASLDSDVRPPPPPPPPPPPAAAASADGGGGEGGEGDGSGEGGGCVAW
jgi:hypothetical protein